MLFNSRVSTDHRFTYYVSYAYMNYIEQSSNNAWVEYITTRQHTFLS